MTATNSSRDSTTQQVPSRRAQELTHKRVTVNGVRLHYVTAGAGPTVLCMHGWPQSHREFSTVINRLGESYSFIAPDLRGFADSDKPYTGYDPHTMAGDMLAILDAEGVNTFHILSHDLGGPASLALAYMVEQRALSLATIETPFFGLDFPGYVDPRITYRHLGMHLNMDISRFLIGGREDGYLRHFFRDFAYDPEAISEDDVQHYVMQMRQPGNLRASLNLYGVIPEAATQTAQMTARRLDVPMLAWGGRASFADHCITAAQAIAVSARGGVIEHCGHWVFEEQPDFICAELSAFWSASQQVPAGVSVEAHPNR